MESKIPLDENWIEIFKNLNITNNTKREELLNPFFTNSGFMCPGAWVLRDNDNSILFDNSINSQHGIRINSTKYRYILVYNHLVITKR